MSHRQFPEELGDVKVNGPITFPAGLVGQGAADIRLPRSGGPGNNAVLVVFHPLAGRQVIDRRPGQSPGVAVIYILDAGLQLEPGVFQAGIQRPVLLPDPLPLNQQGKPVLKGQPAHLGLLELLLVRFRHSIELHRIQFVHCRLVQHKSPPWWFWSIQTA